MNASTERYIHSFEPAEQARLIRQGRFLEPWTQPHLDLSACSTVLEVGCGVGAQLQVLLRRFPDIKFTGIDVSAVQLRSAQQLLADPILAGRVDLLEASAYQLPFPDDSFDGACIFWVLEHLNDPTAVLCEVLRVLKPGGALYCTEVFNSGLYARPRQAALENYWRAFNDLQEELGGDPDVGIKLGALFAAAGFERVVLHDASPQLDARLQPLAERRDFLDFWLTLLLSGASKLEQHGRISPQDRIALKADFAALAETPEAIFRYTAMQACGHKPVSTDAQET